SAELRRRLSPLSLPFSGNQREHKPKRGRDAGQARLATPRYSLPDKVGGRPAFALLLSKHERGKLLALFLERQGRGCSSITALLLMQFLCLRGRKDGSGCPPASSPPGRLVRFISF